MWSVIEPAEPRRRHKPLTMDTSRRTTRVRDLLVMFVRLGMVHIRTLLGSGRFWSGILCAAMFSRGSSFIDRPPPSNTLTSGAIEAFISYQTWGYLLIAGALLIGLAYSNKKLRVLGIAGHLIGMWAYGTFALSTVISAVGFGQPWATAGTFISQSLLHAACAIFLGDDIGKAKEVNGE